MTKTTTALLAALACLAFAAIASAGQTYKWVDKDGKVHYSDQPVAGAEKVDLKPVNEVPGMPVEQAQSSDQPPAEPLDSATQYVSFVITSPKNGEVLRGAGIGLSIEVELNPPLGDQDKVEYLLDGKVVGASVPYVERGTHSVSARVVDPNGRTKITADSVTIQVFQNIAQPPPTPPKKP